jgi:hypothetical protein
MNASRSTQPGWADGLDPRIATALVSVAPTSGRPAWHGAPTVLGLLRGVSPETALFRPRPQMNCIREIALHVAYWNFRVGNLLTGQQARLDVPQRAAGGVGRVGEGWPKPVQVLPEGQWMRERTLVEISFLFLHDAVRDFDPARLDEPPPGAKQGGEARTGAKPSGRPASQYIHGVAEHNLYHAAQIKALKLLAGGKPQPAKPKPAAQAHAGSKPRSKTKARPKAKSKAKPA